MTSDDHCLRLGDVDWTLSGDITINIEMLQSLINTSNGTIARQYFDSCMSVIICDVISQNLSQDIDSVIQQVE